ncbi:MAG: prepilin-type N-terminal cleavage/methylation domain-containing protein [Pyrinomonadaceae bacterium]
MRVPTKKDRKYVKPSSQSGFSLLELLVSMVIFLIVSASVWGVLRTAQQSRTAVNEEVQLAKNVRIALNLVSRDAFNAGFGYPAASTVVLPDNRISAALGIPNDFDTSRDTVPPVIAGNNITLSTFATTANTRTDQVTFLYKDNTFNVVSGVSQPLNVNAATTTTGGIDEIVPISGSNASCQVNDIYIIIGNTGSTLGLSTALSGTNKIQFANGDLLGFNQTGTTGPLRSITVPASIQRVRMVTYFVTPDGILTRREYANVTPAVAFVDEPLVYNVENFQIQYVMDSGAVSDNPSAGPDTIAGNADDVQNNLAAVRQIRFTVNVRSTEKNSKGEPFTESMTTTVSTRNLGYEAS